MWIAPRDHKVVGETLEALRKSAGVTQQELAKRLRKPQSFISAYESGQRRVDLLELARIAASLGADPRKICAKILNTLLKDQKPKVR